MGAVTLICGNASDYQGTAHFILTHPYAPLPRQLRGLPMLINLALPIGHRAQRIEDAERWCGAKLTPLSDWAKGGWNTIFCANMPPRDVDLTDLEAVEPGWFPEELPRRLLKLYADMIPPGGVIWDGFCGRGTVGKVALELGYKFVGMDNRADRVALAREYLVVDGCLYCHGALGANVYGVGPDESGRTGASPFCSTACLDAYLKALLAGA